MIKIEEGKYYLNRNGGLVGPMASIANGVYCWQAVVADEEQQFTERGRFFIASDDPRDLVQEYTGNIFVNNTVASAPAVAGEPPYSSLAGILQMAHDQAASGKGRNRHSDDKPFLKQPIMEIARMLGGTGGHAYQIMKKAQEANRMVGRGQHEAAVAEYLGVINYAAAAILLIREL